MPDTGGFPSSLAALLLLCLTACGGGGGGSGGGEESADVGGGGGVGNSAPVCTINTPPGDVTIKAGGSVNFTATVSDPDAGDVVTIHWTFTGGSPASSGVKDPGTVLYPSAGTFVATLEASDNQGAACAVQSRTVTVTGANPSAPGVSINSTSLDSAGKVTTVVPQQPQVANTGYSVLAINDLGMHCGDLDTRVASILPPF